LLSRNVQFDVFEIFPSLSDPTFRRTALLKLTVTPTIHASDLLTYLGGDLFLCHYADRIIAWNVVDNAWISWRIDVETQEVNDSSLWYLDSADVLCVLVDLCV
jgi:hypothetical protein